MFEAAELLDVDVDQFAGVLALVAADRFSRLQCGEPVEAESFEDAAEVAADTPVSAAICLPVQRWRRKASTCAITASGVGRLSRRGRDERSCSPATPSALKRFHHLRAVRGQTPAARAAASGACPLSIWRAIRSRPCGVKRAFLWTLYSVLPGSLELRQPQLPRSGPDGTTYCKLTARGIRKSAPADPRGESFKRFLPI